MPQQLDTTDLRRAPEPTLLDALASGNPLALAEAYHRTVPAAHAVARRLITGADAVEDLLLEVYTEVWHSPPTDGPLEGWIRRQTWQQGVDQLRERGVAPASPSAAGLLPDLPAPEVRFLDAAERAIAELPDDERRALLLAHDSGVPSADQGDGAADSLARALMTLAGPETSTGDRAALHEDGCDDVTRMGDWCLGVADTGAQDEVSESIRSRPGCAAKSRAVRRGRRRIEGLPATADMGQRILVTVLTAGGQSVAQSTPPPAAEVPPVESVPEVPREPETSESEPQTDDPFATGPLPTMDAASIDDDDYDDDADDTADLPQVSVAGDDDYVVDEAVVDDDVVDDDVVDDDAEADDEDMAPPPHLTAVDSTAQLDDTSVFADPDVAVDAEEDGHIGSDDDPVDPTVAVEDENWRPDPGSTAELRLSDILAEGEADDDPFADMDDLDDDLRPAAGPGDPYAALQRLEGTQDAHPEPRLVPLDDDNPLVDGYVEGQDDYDMPAGRRSNIMAEVLSWVLPILGGSIIGITVAILFFGLPS